MNDYQHFENWRKATKANILAEDDAEMPWLDNQSADSFIDANLKFLSERLYRRITERIVNKTFEQLRSQEYSKRNLKKFFTWFFIVFISVQYVILAVFLFIKAFNNIDISDTVIITYMSSVFVETLGVIGFMIKYAFDSTHEVNILDILKSVISNYQK